MKRHKGAMAMPKKKAELDWTQRQEIDIPDLGTGDYKIVGEDVWVGHSHKLTSIKLPAGSFTINKDGTATIKAKPVV